VVLIVEAFERRLTEALAASMAQQQQPVVALDAGWIVDELEGGDRPGLDAGASQQILTDQRAVVTGPGADQKDARASGQSREDGRRRRVAQQSLDRVRLCLKGLVEKRAESLQAASSQAFRNW
jgi:hypothetical protein